MKYVVYNGKTIKNRIFSKYPYISTNSESFDSLLDYGIMPYRIYNFYGEAGSGKTILLHQIAANAAKINGKVYYIDLEYNFNPTLILNISKNREFLNNIYYFKIKNFTEFLYIISKLLESNRNIDVLLIDNITNLFNLSYNEDDQLKSFQPIIIIDIMYKLNKVKELLGIPIVITSGVRSLVEEVLSNAYKAYGDPLISSLANFSIQLIKDNNLFRAVNPLYKGKSALFIIKNGIITDI